jgi:hypothetical protein
MMKGKFLYKWFAAFAMVWVISSCDYFDLDINEDPNNPSQAAPELLLTSAQYSIAANLAGGTNDAQMGFAGIIASFDNFNMSNSSFNGIWNNLYAGPLKDLEGIIDVADVDNNGDGKADNPHYLAIAQTLKAYVASTLVDLFGDIPFSEALQGDADAAIKNPNFDTDADVYNACFGLLDQAIANFALSSPVAVKGDAIYNGNVTRWKKFANTLKLRLYVQARLAVPNAATEINKLLAEPGNLITAAADDFQFQFSKLVAPDNRHPWYQASYTSENGFTYILHQPMVEMLADGDPRFPFYFRRQSKQVLDQSNPSERNTTPCSMTVGCQYGYLVLNDNVREQIYGTTDLTQDQIDFLAGCFGRDRADPAGVPLDGDLRLIPGVYPCGGYYDVATPALPGSNKAPGGGIFPIITHVNTLYYQIEAVLTLGSAGDARALFESAIRKHIDKVVNFGKATDANSVSPAATDIDAYVATWLERFDNASTNEAKLNVAMKQLWLSSWGNGYEIFNAMRRTGYPSTIQIPINPVRDFPLRLPYPQVELTLNPNASAYSSVVYDRDPIFWDK